MGVVFGAEARTEGDALSPAGTVVCVDGSTAEVDFSGQFAAVLTTEYGHRSPAFTVAVDLRNDAITTNDVTGSVHSQFGMPEPADYVISLSNGTCEPGIYRVTDRRDGELLLVLIGVLAAPGVVRLQRQELPGPTWMRAASFAPFNLNNAVLDL